jgi:hypothetical protein
VPFEHTRQNTERKISSPNCNTFCLELKSTDTRFPQIRSEEKQQIRPRRYTNRHTRSSQQDGRLKKNSTLTWEFRLPVLVRRRMLAEVEPDLHSETEFDTSAVPLSDGASSMALRGAGTLMQRLVASARLARDHAAAIALYRNPLKGVLLWHGMVVLLVGVGIGDQRSGRVWSWRGVLIIAVLLLTWTEWNGLVNRKRSSHNNKTYPPANVQETGSSHNSSLIVRTFKASKQDQI